MNSPASSVGRQKSRHPVPRARHSPKHVTRTVASATATLIHYTRRLTRIPVQTPSRSYEVLVERGLLRSAAAALRDTMPPEWRVFVVTQAPVRKHWGGVLRKSFSKAGRKVEIIQMPDGERSKTLSQLEK